MSYPYSGSVYDQIARTSADLTFWRGVLAEHPGAVLELGVGTGRLALELAQSATEYHGLDLEPSMLAEAERKSRDRGVPLILHAGSFLALNFGRTFDVILLPANTISHVLTETAAEDFFRGVRRHCAPGGLFVLDTYNPRPWTRLAEPYVFGQYTDPADGADVIVWSTPAYDAATQIATHALEYRKGSHIVDRRVLQQRTYFPAELTALLRQSGFRDVALYGDYDRGPLRTESARLIAFAV